MPFSETPFLTRRLILWLLILLAFYIFLDAIHEVLLPFIIGGLLAYFLDPLADRLERNGMGRGAAAGLIIGIFSIVISIGIILLIPIIASEINDFARTLPAMIDRFREAFNEKIMQFGKAIAPEQAEEAKKAVTAQAAPLAKNFLKNLFTSGQAVINFVTLMVITPVVSFYLLRDWDRMVARVYELLPRDYAPTIREMMYKIDRTISGYLHGMLNVILLLAAFYIFGLSLVGLDLAIVVGIIGGIAIIIPYIGTIVSGGLAVGLAYLQFSAIEPVLVVLAIFTAGQLLEGYVLTPKLVGDKIGLHPLWLIFGMLAGAALFGFVGILLAIPITAIIGVVARYLLDQYRHSHLYLGDETQQE